VNTFWMASMAIWLPVILTALGVILVITLRWFSYKERMALISQGFEPPQAKSVEERSKLLLASGLIVGLVGLAITIALFTIGVGIWLLFGLLPLFIGLALVLTALVLRPGKPKAAKDEKPAEPRVTAWTQEAVVVEAEEEEPEEEEAEDEEEEDVPFFVCPACLPSRWVERNPTAQPAGR
jgi:hypothetical protein